MTWFSERKCEYLPKHFVPTTTLWSEEKELWALEQCTGRYYVGIYKSDEFLSQLFYDDQIIYFEDPQEAVLYELTWS
jgi:hypothetical protein